MRLTWILTGVAILLSGCAAAGSSGTASSGDTVLGYQYQDPLHPRGSAPYSPQAAYNAAHGTYLWPPVENIR
jgi:hypothetical protein